MLLGRALGKSTEDNVNQELISEYLMNTIKQSDTIRQDDDLLGEKKVQVIGISNRKIWNEAKKRWSQYFRSYLCYETQNFGTPDEKSKEIYIFPRSKKSFKIHQL